MNRFNDMTENLQMSETAKQDLMKKCIEGKRTKDVRFRYSKELLAGIIIMIIAINSAGAYAAISFVQDRLDHQSSEVKQQYKDYVTTTVDNFDEEFSRYSRNFTEREYEALSQLEKDYRNGTFPEAEFVTKETNDEVAASDLCFVHESGQIHLPEEEMNQEQMLELIDYCYKFNYAIYGYQIAEEGYHTNTEFDEEAANYAHEIINLGGITIEEAMKKASGDMDRLFHIQDLTPYEKVVEVFSEVDDISYGYMIHFSLIGPANMEYYFTYEAISGKLMAAQYAGEITDFDGVYSKEEVEAFLPIGQENVLEFSKTQLGLEIEGAIVENSYEKKSDGTMIGEFITYSITLSTGEKYQMYCSIRDGSVNFIRYYFDGENAYFGYKPY